MRIRSLLLLVERCLRLSNPLSQRPPLRISNYLRVSAALRKCARNNVEVLQRRDDLGLRHDVRFADRTRVCHKHALVESPEGVTRVTLVLAAEVRLSGFGGRQTGAEVVPKAHYGCSVRAIGRTNEFRFDGFIKPGARPLL